jgi:elongation factor G
MAKDKSAPGFPRDRVRNIGIAAHVDAGKTTLTERVLFYTKTVHRIGEVHEGAAHMDWMAEEQAHGITITAAVTQCPWQDHLVQIVDTPGHVDFTIEVERSMRVLDGAIIVMDGVRGVEPQTETVWRQANKHRVPRFVFVNKMDRPGADFSRAMDSMRRRLREEPVPVCVPLVASHEVLHVIEGRVYTFNGANGEDVTTREPSASEAEDLAVWRETLYLALGEHDEALADIVLGEEQPPEDMVWAVLKKATLAGKVRPMFSGSALRNWGVQPMLDAVLKVMPSPLERPPPVGKDLKGGDVVVDMVDGEPLVALAFKVQLLEGRRHVFVRMFRGTLEPGQEVWLSGRDTTERVARVFEVDANHKSRVDKAWAGQIVVLAGLRWATTGDTLCAPGSPVLLERIDARQPVLGLAIEPRSSREEEKVLEAINKMTEEDPTLKFEEDAETGQRVLKGMGELHLQIAFERMEREFGVGVVVGTPRVANRETVLEASTVEGEVDRVIEAGASRIELKAKVLVQVRPLARGSGTSVVCNPEFVPAELVPTPEMVAAVRDGATDAASSGPLEGNPLEDVEITIVRVTTFPPASPPQALRIAAASAVRLALESAKPAIMQPIMRCEVVVPEEHMGGIIGDLQSRGANILGTESEGDTSSISCECGLKSLLGYTTDLRSMTRGRGQFVMEFERFDVL